MHDMMQKSKTDKMRYIIPQHDGMIELEKLATWHGVLERKTPNDFDPSFES